MRNLLPPELKIDEMIRRSELTFLDMVRAFESYSVRDCVRVYGIIGGVPAYMHAWNPAQSVKENVCRLILSENGLLYDEAERYLGSELRELSVYYTILGAIAKHGVRKLNDLYNETGFSRAKISVYMKHMAAFEVIEKVYPFETGGYENAQKGMYRIKNTFLNFWFHFIYPHLSERSMMEPEVFYDTYVAPGMDDYLNRYFVDVCMEYLRLLDKVGQLPIKIKKMGTWIGKEGAIDIIAQDEARNRIVGMCKWSEKVMTYEMCKQLQETMKLAVVKAKCIFLFSAGTFDGILTQKAANDPSLMLVDMNRL
jgi:AAA+ ATPase superfamily predicted ATPase